jgi:hypothetical protein
MPLLDSLLTHGVNSLNKGLTMQHSERQKPELGWTKEYKLTANGVRVRTVNWHEDFVTLSTDSGQYTMDKDAFYIFVSQEWNPDAWWNYL